MGNGSTTLATGKGTVILGDKSHILKLTNVLYVPDIRCNLLSVSRLDSSCYNVMFSQGKSSILDQKGQTLAEACLVNGLYQIYEPKAMLNIAVTKSKLLQSKSKALPLDI